MHEQIKKLVELIKQAEDEYEIRIWDAKWKSLAALYTLMGMSVTVGDIFRSSLLVIAGFLGAIILTVLFSILMYLEFKYIYKKEQNSTDADRREDEETTEPLKAY